MEQQMQAGGIVRHSEFKIVAGRKKTHHWFTVTGNNNKILVTSETYKTKQAMEKGITALGSIIAGECSDNQAHFFAAYNPPILKL